MSRFAGDSFHFAIGIEDTFIAEESPGARKLDEYELTQHDRLWWSDLALAAETGATMVRWGVPWYRVNPERGRWEFGWLDRVVDRFAELGLTPIVDLMHYGTPLWLQNGFANAAYPERVAEYGAAIAERYRDRLDVFTPMNEPLLNALYCGEYAEWPPYFRGDDGFVRILERITRGIVLTQQAIADVQGARASFVHVEASYRFGGDVEAEPDLVAHLRHRAFLVEDLVTGAVGDDHPLVPWLLRAGFPEASLQWHRATTAQPDVMGVNYYPHQSTEAFEQGVTHAGTLADPRPRLNGWTDGLSELLRAFWKRYDRPVMLTETNVHSDDAAKAAWFDASLAAIDALRADGVPVVGHTWWPLFDSVAWRYRHETKPLESYFGDDGAGLWRIEPDGFGSLPRVRTPFADHYSAAATTTSTARTKEQP